MASSAFEYCNFLFRRSIRKLKLKYELCAISTEQRLNMMCANGFAEIVEIEHEYDSIEIPIVWKKGSRCNGILSPASQIFHSQN